LLNKNGFSHGKRIVFALKTGGESSKFYLQSAAKSLPERLRENRTFATLHAF
jgi:hypothetical protein